LVQAIALLFSLPATPFVYYGEEIGLCASDAETQEIRNPMQWDDSPGRGFTTGTPWAPLCADASINVAAQDGVDGSLLETYRAVIALRRSSPALRAGSYRAVTAADAHVYAFLREAAGERVLAVYNFDSAPHPAAVNLAAAGVTNATVVDRVFSTPELDVTPANAAAWGPELTAYGARWFALTP
jgi:glycosidase